MPGPYKRKPADVINIGPDVLDQRADLAKDIALISAYWEDLELQLSRMFCAVLLRQERKAFEIYHMFHDRDIRKQALRVVAKDTLPKDKLKEIEDFYNEVRVASKERNEIIHGLWAITNRKGKETVLLRVEESVFNDDFSGYIDHLLANLFATVQTYAGSGHVPPREHLQFLAFQRTQSERGDINDFVQYDKTDFTRVKARIKSLRDRAVLLLSDVVAVSIRAVTTEALSLLQLRQDD